MNDRALSTLIRLARAEAEARQRDVAEIAEAIAALDARDAALAAEVAAEQSAGGPGFGPYAARILRERQELARRRGVFATHEAALREALGEAFRELKKLERLHEMRADASRAAEAKRETAALDAVAGRARN